VVRIFILHVPKLIVVGVLPLVLVPEKEEEEEQAWYDQGLFGNLLDGLASEQPGYPPVV